MWRRYILLLETINLYVWVPSVEVSPTYLIRIQYFAGLPKSTQKHGSRFECVCIVYEALRQFSRRCIITHGAKRTRLYVAKFKHHRVTSLRYSQTTEYSDMRMHPNGNLYPTPSRSALDARRSTRLASPFVSPEVSAGGAARAVRASHLYCFGCIPLFNSIPLQSIRH